jgi:hypothetical protein
MKLATKHWLALLAFVIVALYVSVTLALYERKEARYQRELKRFSEAYKPEMKREDLENYFRSRNIHFSQMCCSGEKHNAMDDLVEVGHEKAGFICEERYVYVAFQFAAVEPNDKWVADSDRLVGTTLFRSACQTMP